MVNIKNLNSILKDLETLTENYKLDDWNEYTRSWSKGYIKGLTEAISIINTTNS